MFILVFVFGGGLMIIRWCELRRLNYGCWSLMMSVLKSIWRVVVGKVKWVVLDIRMDLIGLKLW